MPTPSDQPWRAPEQAQSDSEKMRRIPFLFLSNSFTNAATISSVGAPLALFATELGLGTDRIGLLGGLMPFFQILGVGFLPLILHFGCKRVAATALLARYVFLLMFLLVPLVQGDLTSVFWLLFAAMALFSLGRSISEAAYVPWAQEFIPQSLRGRIFGQVALAQLPVALLVSFAINLWLDSRTGIGRFYPVFVVAVVLGAIGALGLYGLGGGRARDGGARGLAALRSLTVPLRDRNFRRYLYTSGTQFMVFLVGNLFILLFFKLRLSIPTGQLVFMSALVPVGGALGGFVAGWFVDRLGSRGVRITAQLLQAALLVGVPFIHHDLPGIEIIVAGVFLSFGFLVSASITAGTVYMLNYVPPARKESYMALAYGSDGIIGGSATFAAGFLVTWIDAHPLRIFDVAIGSYQSLFVICALIIASSALVSACLREDGATGVKDFLTQFYSVNSLGVLWGIHSYANPTSEERRRDLAYRFGGARSVLAKAELLEALHDPSFDVRYEAIGALGHLPRSDSVVRALEKMLKYDGLIELQYGALASLGRIRSRPSHAVIAGFLNHENALLRARAIRSLGDLGEQRYLAQIREGLAGDSDVDCRLAAVSALGKLRDRDSLGPLLRFYAELGRVDDVFSDEPRSKVILLALAKILNCEESFAHEWRNEEKLPGYRLTRLIARIADAARRLPRFDDQVRRELAQASGALGDGRVQPALQALQGLRPLIASSRRRDAGFVLEMLDAARAMPRPHPAFLVLLCIALRPVLKPGQKSGQKPGQK
jgi:Major Facilitator Superfamily/HEAT repeats